jgi:hypothetical protein
LRETNLKTLVITVEERLSARDVLLGWPGSYGLVCDIGGRRWNWLSCLKVASAAESRRTWPAKIAQMTSKERRLYLQHGC